MDLSKLTDEKLNEFKNLINDYKNNNKSTCIKRYVIAMIYDIDTNKPVSFGKNGPMEQCECIRKGVESGTQLHLCNGAHAEISALINIAKNPDVTINENSIMVVTHMPCLQCAAVIIESGIKTVLYLHEYPSVHTEELFYKNDVQLLRLIFDKE